MRADDVKVLFKSTAFKPEDIRSYVINLLNKFEVALMWGDRRLLIPSLLPSEKDIRRNISRASVFSTSVSVCCNNVVRFSIAIGRLVCDWLHFYWMIRVGVSCVARCLMKVNLPISPIISKTLRIIIQTTIPVHLS